MGMSASAAPAQMDDAGADSACTKGAADVRIKILGEPDRVRLVTLDCHDAVGPPGAGGYFSEKFFVAVPRWNQTGRTRRWPRSRARNRATRFQAPKAARYFQRTSRESRGLKCFR